MSEGILNRLVRAQLSKGVKDKGKMHYEIRIDNASPLVLNGLAALGRRQQAPMRCPRSWSVSASRRAEA